MEQAFIRDANYLKHLKGKTIGIFGYTNDSKEEAISLVNNGIQVIIGLRPVDDEWTNAEQAGFDVRSLEDAVEACDIVQVW
ncbi:hypothetical protein [Bacillus sp. Marseille-P3661]|uniref:hypothetical protein n=1 Tax=Bacillus sp. Marseille-P3661 TaxID=1936234 RepID=UPI000C8515A1|nr:hypothetical protein [Bacillus sp. Marseille-P3661]